ncbi:MAG: hypothetical protein ACK4GR_00135, partial [bacterium]
QEFSSKSENKKQKETKKSETLNKNLEKFIEKFLANTFKKIDKKQIQIISKFCKIKKIRKSVSISKGDLENKKFRFLKKHYCLVKENVCFTFIETNYRKIIIELFYPNSFLDLEFFEILPEASVVLPRNTELILIPKNFPEFPEIEEVLKQYKIDLESQKKREFLLEIANWKSLDSINRLLYFLYQYLKKSNLYLDNNFVSLPSKKVISYITGNSHEVIIRNFKKLEKMNYLVSQGNKIKINYQKVEQWIKNSKIIV